MLQILKTANEDNIEFRTKNYANIPNNDIFIMKDKVIEDVKEDGTITRKIEKTEVNITRKINETAKLIKQMDAQERIKKLEEILEEGE